MRQLNQKNMPPKRSLTVGERDSIKDLISEKSQLLKATDEVGEGALTVMAPKETGLNKDRLRADIKRLEETLVRESPQAAAPRERDGLERRRNEIAEKLKADILETREEIAVTNNQHPAWVTAIKKGQMRPKYEGLIHEYREICKRLDPDDPNAGSLDAIRRDR